MATTTRRSPAQIRASLENIKKAQAKRKSMTHRQHALAQPQWRSRKKPGSSGEGDFYHIEIRPKAQFTSFRTQDVWEKGGLERVAWRRPSGSRDTATRLVSKEVAHMTADHKLIIDETKARSVLDDISGEITRVKGDTFKAKPRKNIPEKDKPTPAMKKAQTQNIKKAQEARKK